MDNESDQKTSGVEYEIDKSTKDLLSKAKIGAKNFLGKSFNKIGGSLVKGLNTAVSLPSKTIGSIGIKTVAPFLFGFFVLFILISMMTISKASPLVPRIESNESNNENSEGGSIGNRIITKTEDGRIKDCGVGMKTNFYQSKTKTMVDPDFLIGGKYDKQLENAVGDSAGTRCGVVYAAQYLAYDFEFYVPYYWGASYKKIGLNPTWGENIGPNEKNKKRFYNGLDCGHFRDWAWVNGGFPGGRPGNTSVIPFGDCEKIKSNIEPGDGLYLDDVDGKDSHSGIVLAYNDTHIKFAHAGGSYGVTTGLVNICTGVQEIDGKGNNFKVLQKKIYNNSDL